MSSALTTHWVCVAARWAVPPTPCPERGLNDKGAEKHILTTGHPTVTTTRIELADRLAWVDPESGAA